MAMLLRYPLLLTGVLGGLSLAFAYRPVFAFQMPAWMFYAGGVLAVFGGLLLLAAAGVFRARGATVDPTKAPTQLVTDGLYRYTRNPMYLGMLLVLIGLQGLLSSPAGLLFPLVFFLLMDRSVIPQEETRVLGVYGEAYRRYQQQTRRWC